MLVLTRQSEQRVLIGSEISVVVLEVRGNRVKLGFEGPSGVRIVREEILTTATEPADAWAAVGGEALPHTEREGCCETASAGF